MLQPANSGVNISEYAFQQQKTNFMARIFLLSIMIIILSLPLSAQTPTDTAKARELDEVVVKAKLRTQKGDTLSVIPSAKQKKFNVNGYELLRGMMLPGLKVNTIDGSLSLAGGESAIVLIDGRPVQRQDVLALSPKQVARVEYVQNPGPEYGYDSSLGAVINFVLKKRTDGYAAAVMANNAVTTAYGQNMVYGKYTRGNSEYGLSFNSEYTSLTKRRIDDTNTYMMKEGPHTVVYKGINTPLKYTDNELQAGYNHFIPGKHIFDITFKGQFYYSPDRAHAQRVTEEGLAPYYQLTRPYEKYFRPNLNIYYKRYLTKTSSITANLVGNYRHTDYRQNITEAATDDFSDPTSEYDYGTKSNRQSYIGEIKYLNNFNRKFNLSVGTRATYAYTSNRYEGDNTSSDYLRDTDIYAYAALSGRFGKFYYLVGMGLNGSLMNQNGTEKTRWTPRPQLQLTYTRNGWRVNLNGSLIQQSPTLSELASTQIRVNRFELRQGNPDLKDWWRYRASFRVSKTFGPVNLQNTLTYVHSHNPVMAYVERRDSEAGSLFVTSYLNQKRMSTLSENFNVECELPWNLTLSGGVQFYSYRSEGPRYSHSLESWQGNVALDWAYGNWNIGMNWTSRTRSLAGETVSVSGADNTLYLNYVIGNQWRIGFMGKWLFMKNGPEFHDDLRSAYMIKRETVVVPAQGNMLMITAAWNFSSGKQRKHANIDLNNEDTESGVFR